MALLRRVPFLIEDLVYIVFSWTGFRPSGVDLIAHGGDGDSR